MIIQTTDYQVVFGLKGYQLINDLIKENAYSKLFILTDDLVNEYCVPYLLQQLAITIDFEIIEIENGEDQKTIETCKEVWTILTEFHADRKAIIVNIGGGMITDLGGFVASAYKRGIDFINIPTSLLAMVDASVGSKNGVNLNGLKNMVGSFTSPQVVVVDTKYLETLPGNQMRSGLAEMYKHALIADQSYWNHLKNLDQMTTDDLEQLIYYSVYLKNEFVAADPLEQNVRKALNFGHTLGHAIETLSHHQSFPKHLLHGEAIAIGMILESYLSFKMKMISKEIYDEIQNTLNLMFKTVVFSKNDIDICIELLKHDKKNSGEAIKFVLLQQIGQYVIDQAVPQDWIYEAFDAYHQMSN